MSCPRCGSDIRPGQKFCANCGLALATACPNCGTAYDGNPRFCAECGHGLGGGTVAGQSTAAGEAVGAAVPTSERRLVSVLFADLVGFTTLSENEDAEEVRELLSRYFELAQQVVASYGGTIEKFIGDAVMAVWGAPVGREDDAERAVRAALELVDRVRGLSVGGQPLNLRAGVLTGEAAVTLNAPGQGMVAGDLVNTASRLQSVAPPGIVLVGETTQRATNAAIAYEPIGEYVLKGKQASVAAWRALRVVARVGGEGREQGLEPPFVGRDEELRLLKDQLHAAARERRLRLVTITGQAGIGKTRLIWELEKYLDGLAGPTLYYWHQGRSPSYGEGVAFWALGEMVRRRARIAETDDPESTRTKLRETLADFVHDAGERRWLEPALGSLLGIDKPESAREQLFSAWRTFFERVADRGPAVFVFEDLQWADDGLLEFIEHLAEWSRDRPMLLITLARPEFLERRHNFGLGQRALVAMHLEPLPADAMGKLLRGVVPSVADQDLARIVDRAEGVPLYAVEMLRTLADQGHLVRRGDVYELIDDLPGLEVPPTLRALIAARLDALEAGRRALLQDAAVLGSTFSAPALAALNRTSVDAVEDNLRELSRKELVALETDPRSPERGQYRFVQAMIREVAYATLARRDRRARHLAAASYYETLGDEELAGVRATHYLEAFRASPEGDEGAAVAAQARVALRAAADRAARLHSSTQALGYYEQTIAVTFDKTDIAELELRAAETAWNLGQADTAVAHAQRSVELYESLGDEESAGRSAAYQGTVLIETSRVDEGMQLLEARLARLRELDLPPSRAAMWLNNNIARGHLFRGEPDPALSAIDEALVTAERLGSRGTSLQLLITKAWAIWLRGGYREGHALLRGAMDVADAEGDALARIRARFNLSSQLVIDDPHEALRIAMEGLTLDKQFGIQTANMAGNAAGAALVAGKLDEIMELQGEATTIRTSLGSFVHAVAGVALAIRGDADAAQRQMEPVAHIIAASDSVQDVASLLLVQAMLELAAGHVRDARRLAVEARDTYLGGDAAIAAVYAGRADALLGDAEALRGDIEWLTDHAVPAYWLERSTRSLQAALKALDGDPIGAAAEYRAVIDEWRAADLPYDLALTLVQRARLLGDVDPDAAAGREEARTIMASMGADGFVERLEQGLPARPPSRPGIENEATQRAAVTTR